MLCSFSSSIEAVITPSSISLLLSNANSAEILCEYKVCIKALKSEKNKSTPCDIAVSLSKATKLESEGCIILKSN